MIKEKVMSKKFTKKKKKIREKDPVKVAKTERIRKKVKVPWLASGLETVFRKTGEYLYDQGLIGDVVDKDGLTGLYNRAFFDQWLPRLREQADRSKTQLLLVYVDLDNLKKINDQQGHEAGDKYIRRFVRLLLNRIRFSDVVFRLGGDEFVIVFWGGNEEQVREKMFKVQKEMEEKGVSFSLGVVKIKQNTNLNRALKEADEEMYEMKKRRKRERKA